MCYNLDSPIAFLIAGVIVAGIAAIALVVINYGMKLLMNIYWQISAKGGVS
ncbi:MAG: hypothetical protein HDQ96_13895 [Lachnospiraceae bacterium]|nr:hypothetical protein [Lachnospiraceae bacterium]